jgi:preprotein translocase subunit SecE
VHDKNNKNGCSSIGRVAVSKTVGWEFESLHPCKNKSNKMKKVVGYIKETYDELMHKVSWPTWSELQGSAIVVSIASLIIALVVYLMDASFSTILKQFYKLF